MSADMKLNLPTYVISPNANLENYNQELNQTLTDFLNADLGWQVAQLSNADVAAVLALVPSVQPPRFWFNTDLAKLQILTAVGTVETVTSV